MKKALIVASVASMILQFNMENIKLLLEQGYKVEVACNFETGSSITTEVIEKLKINLTELGVDYHQVDFDRNVYNIRSFFKAKKQMDIILKNGYNLIHCHSPIGGMITRLCARKYRKKGTKVIYTAHGFHFFKGAPIKNWILFYPIEKICSKYTDILITINKEDFELANRKMKSKKNVYIPGVGVDVEKFQNHTVEKEKILNSLNIPKNSFIIISVGELNENKNHQIVIKALGKINDPSIHYIIAGKGKLEDSLIELSKKERVSNNVHLLGFRKDVMDLYKISDLMVHPSFREGLPVSIMEGLSSGLRVLASNTRGCRDLINGENGALFSPNSSEEIAKLIVIEKQAQKINAINAGEYNFSIENVMRITKGIYEGK